MGYSSVLHIFSTALFALTSGTLLKPPSPHDHLSTDWWQDAVVDIAVTYAPLTSAYLVCVKEDCFLDETIRRIDKAITVWNIDVGNVTVPQGHDWDMFVIVLSSEDTVIDFIAKHDTSANPLYLFVLPVDATEDEVSSVFESCLSKYMLRAVVLVPGIIEKTGEEEVKSISVYTYNPFVNESNCSDTTPVQIFSWNVTDDLDKNVRAIPDRNVRNMRGCTVRVAARTSETNLIIVPVSSNENDTYGNWTFAGPWSRVFFAVLQGMNAKPDLRKSDEDNFPDNYEESDEVFFGRFSTNAERYYYFDFPSAARVQCYTYCVPRASPQDPVWFLLVGEYTMEVWLLMLVTMFAVAIIYIPLMRWKSRSFGFALFYFFAAVNSSMHPDPKWDSARIVFALWSMFVMVMTTAYQGVLQGFRTAPPQLDSVKDVGSLLQSTLIIRGPPVLIKVLHNLLEDSEGGHNYDSRLIPYAEGVDIDEESLSDRYVHMCSSVEFISLNNRKKRHLDGRLRYYKILNHCVLTQTERLVLLPKNSPFLSLISEIILRLTEGGLLAHVMDVPEPFDIITVGVQPLGLARIKSPLTLLAIGCCVAFIVFLAEVRGSMDWT